MDIKNVTPVDEMMYVKLQHFGMRIFKKHNFLNYFFWGCIAFFAFVYSVVSIVLFYTPEKNVGFPYHSLFICVVLTGFHIIYYFILPRQMYKTSALYRAEEKYVFGDDEIFNETCGPKCNVSVTYKYSDIKKVYEKTGVFYVYFSKKQVILISKSGFETEKGLCFVREKLKSSVPAKKYKVIK